jgi:hypothetical protein
MILSSGFEVRGVLAWYPETGFLEAWLPGLYYLFAIICKEFLSLIMSPRVLLLPSNWLLLLFSCISSLLLYPLYLSDLLMSQQLPLP